MQNNKIHFQHFETAQEMMMAYPLIKQMYEDLSEEKFFESVQEMIKMNNFKMIGAFVDGQLVGACGYWVLLMLYCGKYIQISNFVVDKNKRSLGIGKKMMLYLENLGRELGCEKFILDSYSENKKSHSLYFEQGFCIRGFHFMKDL